ncbi:radical SAM family heme chaperone HemW [Micromonospora craniellae]|uniref:Heme chaperone HemW n=1 Tax=Micromonospora craniellae TaxID=2294034 RepID=A0A372FVX0_9ACTN|nr:radical SAM family heme chaperone HemW [Micromonospora craniellae]QOC90780.1 coproporphyrinogen III oxidase [Micromonospora craniellae]RFS44925.1 coproporphyrinogen III oxidase [Micromonospora craniellae]
MPGLLPAGEPVPTDGSLPASARARVGHRGFGVYVHVPFCASRCGYCDFNTYTAEELGGASREGYADTVLAELALAARVLGETPPGRVETVFVGGGTPTLLPADDLARILDAIDRTWGLDADAEVTTEANPESVDPVSLKELRAAGYTRISLGMQSATPGVLAVLDRKHRAGRAPAAALEARDAGFAHVNLDLIYGTPGERAEDFAESLAQVVAAGVDHVSAYALIVEAGTRLAARMRRGELPYPDDDVAAERYLAAEAALDAAGFSWYEVSNWARTPAARCRHNLLYWTGGDWWGLGPGAHSHIGGVRWWNVKHPREYAGRLAAGESPGLAREVLTGGEAHMEDVMLRLRLASGLPLDVLDDAGRAAAARAVGQGLLAASAHAAGHAVLTVRGRLLADAVVRDLLP